MKTIKSNVTGIIECGQKGAVFFEEDFTFNLMPTKVIPLPNEERINLHADDAGYLCGRTHDNHRIAIYARDIDFMMWLPISFNTNLYLIERFRDEGNTTETKEIQYDAIEFSGKNLCRVFFPQGLSLEEQGKQSKITYNDDSMSFSFASRDIEYTLTVQSLIPRKFGVNGTFITNDEVLIRLQFSKSQYISDIWEHINNISTLIAFMTFRSNVSFDKIALLKRDGSELSKTWDVFLKCPEDRSTKTSINCITFQALGSSVENLLKIIYNKKNRRPSYSLGFIPEKDSDVGRFDNHLIRAICAGLECEIECSNIVETAEAKMIQSLAKEVEDFIKTRWDNEYNLSSDSRSKIVGNLKHWGMATTDNIICLYRQYEKAMQSICRRISFSVSNDDINEFVKYRNDITHGSYRISDSRIENTAYVLECLVYCSLLSRVNLDKSKIEQMCSRLIIGV